MIRNIFNNVRSWSTQNKLYINTDKTKEIIFHRPAARNLCIPPPLPGIKRVKQATLLGIDATDTLSTAAYVDRLLTVCKLISVCISYPTVQYSQFKNCYINRCLFKYV